jgi:hypothetical protein
MFSTKINLYKPFSRLINKNKLLTLDVIYKAQPFVDVVSSNQNTYNLNTVYKAQPFIGTPNNYIRRPVLIGVNHPDVETWLNTLSLSGGTASSSTISALNTFCNSIDSAGLRRKFYRLNLFCGDNLNSCLVPLYVSSWWNEPVYGFSIDQNFNFSSSDYTETGIAGGLKGDGTSKGLRTGVLQNLLTAGNRHLSAYEIAKSSNTFDELLGSDNGISINPWRLTTWNTTDAMGYVQTAAGHATISSSYSGGGGLWFGTGPATSSVLYRNGTLSASDTGRTTATPGTESVSVLCISRQGSLADFSAARLGAYSIGLSMSDSEILNFYNIMQTFQTALNRNV